jgi:hypothetical protein
VHAYVDESHYAGPPSFYLLAAVLVDEESIDRAREAMRGLRVGNGRVHWHRESPRRRRWLSVSVAELGLPTIVVIGTPVDLRKQERARRQCLEQLLWHLAEEGVSRCCLESRGRERDGSDRLAFAAFRGTGVLGRGLHVQHGLPGPEPLLWVADVVAGAATEAEHGDARFLMNLGDRLTLYRFRPR